VASSSQSVPSCAFTVPLSCLSFRAVVKYQEREAYARKVHEQSVDGLVSKNSALRMLLTERVRAKSGAPSALRAMFAAVTCATLHHPGEHRSTASSRAGGCQAHDAGSSSLWSRFQRQHGDPRPIAADTYHCIQHRSSIDCTIHRALVNHTCTRGECTGRCGAPKCCALHSPSSFCCGYDSILFPSKLMHHRDL